jgi:hypothetical protein
MDAQPPKPTRLTLVFFAAFAASFVQDRYTSPDIYRWVAGDMFQAALDLLILAAFLVVVLGASIRSLRHRLLPWAHAASAFFALVTAELIWRYGVNSLPGMSFKDVAIALDIAKPIVLMLGLASILSERRLRLRRASSPTDAATA